MTPLKLHLPQLKEGEQPMEFPDTERKELSSWCSQVTVVPQGLAYYRRLGLMTRLHGEAGRLFQAQSDPQSVANQWVYDASDNDDESDDSSSDDDRGAESHQQPASQRKKFTQISEEDLLVNWYDVLKLEQQEGATDEQIRQAYKRCCLETHPDKQKDHSDELFKKVQRAFDILGDPDARRSYDSSRPFDDSIPDAVVEESMFYRTFGPVFERNKKWSIEKDLPSLGNDTTAYPNVVRFYDRWSTYQSWRDFSHVAELSEIDDSMCREERRYYMRENERQLAQHHRQELKRIRTLVERARKNDPRLRRKRDEDEAKRKKEQEEREAFRQQLRAGEQLRQKLEEEKERSRQQEAIRAVQAQKDAIRQAQRELLAFFEMHHLIDETPTNKILSNAVRKPNITWLFLKINGAQEAQAVLEAVRSASTTHKSKRTITDAKSRVIDNEDEGGDDEVEAVRVFNRLIYEREKLIGVDRYGEPIKKAGYGDKVNVPSAASTGGGGAGTSSGNKKQPSPVVWTPDALARLQKATAKYPPGTIERWPKIVAALQNRYTEEQAMAKVNELNASLSNCNSSQSGAGGAAGVSGGGGSSDSASAATATTLVDDWTMRQQKQLEQGLRELKDYKEKDKFQKIAGMVDGKTAKECFDRYKFLCSIKRKA
ncbi:unnamed protein product [Phytomonas sp. EM1]|nr:unnamed protein product [Phytomonas sp. EM1]|eukprot:CCW64463.1 unnamed protein product [Phytomonas sp. isolate EM1]